MSDYGVEIHPQFKEGFQAAKVHYMERIADLEAQLTAAQQQVVELGRDAANWQALTNCARLRVMGSAGFGNDDNYRHLGIEFWTMHPDQTTNSKARAMLVEFVETVKALKQLTAALEG